MVPHVFLSIACQTTTTPPSTTSPGAFAIDDLTVAVDGDQPSVLHVSFTTSEDAPAFVRFGEDGALDRVTPADAGGTTHTFQLFGNHYDATVSVEAVALTGEGEVTEVAPPVATPAPPAGVPRFTLTTSDPSSTVAGGFVVLTFEVGSGGNATHYVGILDGEARWVWLRQVTRNYGTSQVLPSLDGTALVWPEYDNFRDELEGYVYEVELDGDVVSYTVAPTIHHALVQLPGGMYAYMGRRFIADTLDEVSGDWLMPDVVMTVPVGDDGSNAATLFDYWDDWWGGDLSYYWLNPCDQQYPNTFGYQNLCEMTHTNSLVYNPDEDALYVYPRLLDTLLKLDASSGDLLWQMSGEHSDFTFPGGAPVYEGPRGSHLWSHGHFSQVWDGGIMVFDNGVLYEPQRSSLVELAWDEDAGTVEEIWRYEDPSGGFTEALGDARKLASGSVLASWMSMDQITEVAQDGTVLWFVDTEGINVRRLFFAEDLYDLRTIGQR